MLPLFYIRWPLPPAPLRMLFWVPPWGSGVSAPSQRLWIYVQQLNSKHIRRLRARLPVSTAVKHAGKSVVMSPYLIVGFLTTQAKSSVSRDPASLLNMMRTPNWFLWIMKAYLFWQIAFWCLWNDDVQFYGWMENVNNTGFNAGCLTQPWCEWQFLTELKVNNAVHAGTSEEGRKKPKTWLSMVVRCY